MRPFSFESGRICFPTMVIDSPSNPIIKALRSLELPKNVRERGQFLVEGIRAVEDGLAAGHTPEICLYSPELLRRTERGL